MYRKYNLKLNGKTHACLLSHMTVVSDYPRFLFLQLMDGTLAELYQVVKDIGREDITAILDSSFKELKENR